METSSCSTVFSMIVPSTFGRPDEFNHRPDPARLCTRTASAASRASCGAHSEALDAQCCHFSGGAHFARRRVFRYARPQPLVPSRIMITTDADTRIRAFVLGASSQRGSLNDWPASLAANDLRRPPPDQLRAGKGGGSTPRRVPHRRVHRRRVQRSPGPGRVSRRA